jgi:hypothetical protein
MNKDNVFNKVIIISFLLLFLSSSCNDASKKNNDIWSPLYKYQEGSYFIENHFFKLRVSTASGLNPHFLVDKKNDVILANDYYYGFGRPQKVKIKTKELSDSLKEITFRGRTDSLVVAHTFVFPKNQGWFEEYVTLKNISEKTLNLSRGQTNIRHGFHTIIDNSGDNHGLSRDWRILAVPFLIHTGTGQRMEYRIKDFVDTTRRKIGSEGWIITNDTAGILTLKYSQEQMEYAVINNGIPHYSSSNDMSSENIVWGGSGVYHGDPEIATNVLPGQTLRLGQTRYYCFTGQWNKGFTLFRKFMDQKGHRFPKDFNPPVHWNELFDNPLWWNPPDTPEKRAQFYQVENMEIEAAKAAEIGCEALYLDPGWDTRMGSSIWAEDRLMSCRDFCNLMEEKYDLKVSVHAPLAVWNDQRAYPESALKELSSNDGPHYSGASIPMPGHNYLCSGAPTWLRTKLNRLLQLASDGIVYFMFDGSNYTGPCVNEEHGHSIPYTREEHIRNYAWLAEKIHERFPEVLIEMHDQVLGPTPERYVPVYYTHNADTFDEIWACEYMWDPMHELVSGSMRAKSLYYYNLAYNIPLYIHINLKTDNKNALAFWWYASTCRHLGIGGKNGVKGASPEFIENYGYLGVGEENTPPPEIWQAHKKAMSKYMRLKPFFVGGEFYGIDELTHVHTLPEKNSAVINCFNLKESETMRKFSCNLSEIGLNPSANLEIKGADHWEISKDKLRITLEIPPRDMRLVKVDVFKN